MSVRSLEGATQTPSDSPMASVDTWTVEVKIGADHSISRFPSDSIRTPPRAIEVVVRELTARPAVVKTSTKESRSQRNFT